MGLFKNIEIDIIDMYCNDDMKKEEISKSLGVSLEIVHDVISCYERGEIDYDVCDFDI
jgi:hypothetical protein